MYQETKSSFPLLVEKEFKHSEAGEAEKKNTKTFPLTFKHHFFKAYRTVDTVKLNTIHNKVGFWAPAGGIDSKNKKVVKESKKVKESAIWQKRKK